MALRAIILLLLPSCLFATTYENLPRQDVRITSAIISIPITVAASTNSFYLTPTISTASCAATATLIGVQDKSYVASVVVNESTSPIRVGPASITSNVGLYIGPSGGNVVLDGYNLPFAGQVYCISTTGYSQPASIWRGKP